MKVMEALAGRRAVREFLADPIESQVLEELAAAATQAPSHMNLQPWAFSLTSDRGTVAQLAREAKRHLLGDLRSGSPFFSEHERIRRADYELFYNAPALIVVWATQDGELARAGCTMAAHSIMLAAHSMGLGSCWVSMALPWLETPAGHAALDVPDDYVPVAPLILGGPAGAPLSPGRFPPRLHRIPLRRPVD